MSNEVMENEEKEKLLRLAEEKKYRQLKPFWRSTRWISPHLWKNWIRKRP